MATWVDEDGEEWVGSGRAREVLKVSASTVHWWTKWGFIPHERTKGGQARYKLSELKKLARVIRERFEAS